MLCTFVEASRGFEYVEVAWVLKRVLDVLSTRLRLAYVVLLKMVNHEHYLWLFLNWDPAGILFLN